MAKPRPNPPVLHMIVVLAVLLVPIVALSAFFTRIPEPTVTPVDYKAVAAKAADEASYEVLVPQNLPEGWITTRARWMPLGEARPNREPAPGDTWQLGVMTPQQMYIAVDQRDRLTDQFVAEITRDGRRDGTSVVDGTEWTRYRSGDGRTFALVLRGDEEVTVVSSDLGYDALEAFTATLRPV